MKADLIEFIRGLLHEFAKKEGRMTLGARKRVNSLFSFSNTFLGLPRKGVLLPDSSAEVMNLTARQDTIRHLKYLLASLERLLHGENGADNYAIVCSKFNEVVHKEIPLSRIKKFGHFFNACGKLNEELRAILYACADSLSSSRSSSLRHHGISIFYGRARPAVEILCPADVTVEEFMARLGDLLRAEGFDLSLLVYFAVVSSPEEMTFNFAHLRLDGEQGAVPSTVTTEDDPASL